MKRPDETYLGDGLYTSFDGFQFWLRAPRINEDHEVALEPAVLGRFKEYVEKTYARLKDEKGAD